VRICASTDASWTAFPSRRAATTGAKAATDITLLLPGAGAAAGAPADGTASGSVVVPIDPTKDRLAIGTSSVAIKSATLDPAKPGVWRITGTIPTGVGNTPAVAVAVGLVYQGMIVNTDPTSSKQPPAYLSGIYVLHN